jgi:Zn-finger nucleic acid-binding protein
MNCGNCGAPMVFVWDRDHFFCEYCKTYEFLAGAPADIKVVDEKSGVVCPLCNTEMQVASMMRARVLQCANCRGILIGQERFLGIVTALRTASTEPPFIPGPPNPEELRRKIFCPLCRNLMDTHPYGGPGNIVVDNCEKCQVLWLDFGELKKVIHAPGRDRSD